MYKAKKILFPVQTRISMAVKKAKLFALGVVPKNINRLRGPLQFSCARSRNALIKLM